MLCPNCNFDNPPEMRFCGMCGTRLAQVCPQCGFGNPLNYLFCGQCGARLTMVPQIKPLLEGPVSPAQFVSEHVPEADSVGQRVKSSVESQPPLQGERRLATVILADMHSSTNLLEQIGSEAWVELMNRVLQLLEAEIYRYGGVVDQFRGDGLVAFWGTVLAHEDDAERAVLAALAMQRSVKALATKLIEQKGIELLLRVGINSGEVIVANIGERSQHSEDTAMGEAIALAARMETAAEPSTVLVSENTYHLVESLFEWQPLGEIVVKGVSRPMRVYRPLMARPDAPRSLRIEAHGLASMPVGREEQFAALTACVEGLRVGRGGIVLLTGDEGMGKSHLVAQVRQHDTRDRALLAEIQEGSPQALPALTWLQGRCRSYEQSWPYSMWLDLLRGWLRVREGEAKRDAAARLRAQAEVLWGERMAEHYPYLAFFLAPSLDEALAKDEAQTRRVKHLDAEGLRQQFVLTLHSWVEAMARQGPLVLVFEDVHWADASSLELLERCLPVCEQLPLLWLIMCRPDRTVATCQFRSYVETGYKTWLTNLVLGPLNEAQSAELIEHLTGPAVLPEALSQLIIGKAEGNPYYLEELVRALIRDGTLSHDDQAGCWRLTRTVTSLDLPDSLRSLLLARIDDLSPEERHLLQMAAVIGVAFWSNVLKDLVGDRYVTERHLLSLQQAGLIRQQGVVPDLGVEYRFESSLIRAAAYESILSAQRSAYHLQVGAYLEDFFGLDSLTSYYGVLAYHYGQAGNAGKELFYTLRAADQATSVYANADALEYYTHALELLDKMAANTLDEDRLYAIRTQRFEVLNGRREVFFALGDSQAGWADARALLPLADQLDDDPAWMVDALLQQPGVAGWRNREELEAGLSMAERAAELAGRLGDRRREMTCLLRMANQRVFLNDPAAFDLADRALQMARELGDQRAEANSLISLGRALAWDQPDRVKPYLEAAIPLSRALDDKMIEVALLDLIGTQFESQGDYYKLLADAHQKQLQIAREIGHRPLEGRALMFCGQVRGIYLGDHEGGEALLEAARQIIGSSSNELFVLLRTIQVLVAQGRLEEARKVLERVHQIGEQNVAELGLAGRRLVEAILCNALQGQDDLHRALQLTEETRRLVTDRPLLPRQFAIAAACESARAHLELARRVENEAEGQQHSKEALRWSEEALRLYEAAGSVQIIECASEEVLLRHSQALAANGRPTDAAACLQRAYAEMMRKHDLIPPDSPFRSTFLENIPLHREIKNRQITG